MAYINGKEILFSAKVAKVGDLGLQEKSIDITQNGSYSVTPDTGKALTKASVKVNVQPRLQEKTVMANGEVVPDEGYDALSKVTVMVQEQKLKQLVTRTLSELTEEDLEGITTIGKYAFYNNEGLASISIPSTVTTISQGAFMSAANLTRVILPTSITTIGQNAFTSCAKMVLENIPPNVKSIGQAAFQGCSMIERVDIPYGVTIINPSAFFQCTNLKSVTLPVTVKELGTSAFGQCKSLTSITIPASVTKIGTTALVACSSLKELRVNATTPPTLGTNAIGSCPFERIIVPTGCASAYKSATNWSTYADYIVEG